MLLIEICLNNTTGAVTLIETCPDNYNSNLSIRQNRKGGGFVVIFSSKCVCNDIDLCESCYRA